MYLYTDHQNHFYVSSEKDMSRLRLPEVRLSQYQPGTWEHLYPSLAS